MVTRRRSTSTGRAPARAKPAAGYQAAGRGGFTLVEMMVAMMIMAVGLLGMASTAGYVVRQVGGGVQQTIAATVVQSRMEWFRSVPCTSIRDSTAVTRGVSERWVTQGITNNVLQVVDSVTYSVSGSQKTRAFTMLVPC